MNCSEVPELGPLYLAGELDVRRAQELSAHVQLCPACEQELGRQQAFDTLFRGSVLAQPVDSSRVERNVRKLIAQSVDSRAVRHRMLGMAAIAAVLLLAALGTRTVLSRHAPPVYAAAARDHRAEILDGQARKWLTDSAAIQALAAREGVSGAAVAAIAPAGYHLAQGKLCRLDGLLFVHLVYVSAVGNFSVFLRRDGAAKDGTPIYRETRGTEHVAAFRNQQLSALIVTEQSGDAALRFARATAAAL
jgi:anti-sigma factor RsiW